MGAGKDYGSHKLGIGARRSDERRGMMLVELSGLMGVYVQVDR